MKVSIDKQANEEIAGVKRDCRSEVGSVVSRDEGRIYFLVDQDHRAAEILFLVLQGLFHKKTCDLFVSSTSQL